MPTRSWPARSPRWPLRGGAALRKAGAREIDLLVALPDVLSPTSAPPVIVRLSDGADAKAIGELLCGGGAVKGPVAWPTCAAIHNAVFAGSNDALARARQINPVERPEVATALATLGETGAGLLPIPSSDRAVVWTRPNDWDVDPKPDMKGIFGHHPGGTSFAFADGSVQFIKDSVDPKVMEKLITRDGGKVLGRDEF